MCTNTFSQINNIVSKENDLIQLYTKIGSFRGIEYDSLSYYSDKFSNDFIQFISKHPTTFRYPFKALTDSNICDIITSADGKLRIYSWDTQAGGTAFICRDIYQWESEGKVYIKVPEEGGEENTIGGFGSRIFTVKIHKVIYYLVASNQVYSHRENMQSISAYRIEGDKLIDTVNIFKNKKSKFNRIDVNFDFFSVSGRPERPVELITFDSKQNIIQIPVVTETGEVTDKDILYKLNGSYFEKIGIKNLARKIYPSPKRRKRILPN